MSSKTQEIYNIVAEAGEPLTSTQIHERSELSASRSDTSAMLCNLVKAGRLERLPRKNRNELHRYKLPAEAGESVPDTPRAASSPEETTAAVTRPRDGRPAVDQADEARAVLERNVERCQQALDDYLAAVADPRVLAPLRAARDSARDALAQLTESDR